MTDVDDPNALRLQISQQRKQSRDLRRRQRGGWFVHDQDADIMSEHSCNLDQLLLGNRELADGDIQRNLNAHAFEDCGGPLLFLTTRNPEVPPITSQEHIVAGIQGWKQAQFLIDHADSGLNSIQRPLHPDFIAVDANRAGIRLMSTGQQTNERTLPGSVLAH